MATITPPDTLPDDVLYEVVDGQVVEKPMSAYSILLASMLQETLGPWARERGLGQVVSEMLFLINRAKGIQRRPDVAFVSAERWPLQKPVPTADAWDVVPDIAIEVMSPSNSVAGAQAKVREYFRAGVRQVWVVHPESAEIYVYDSPKSVRIFDRADVLDCGPLLPGFLLPLARFFGTPAE